MKNERAEVWFLYGSASHGFSVQLVSYTMPQKETLGEATVVFEGTTPHDSKGVLTYLTDLSQKYKGLLRIEIRFSHKKKTVSLTTEKAMEILPPHTTDNPHNDVTVRFKSLVDFATATPLGTNTETPQKEKGKS